MHQLFNDYIATTACDSLKGDGPRMGGGGVNSKIVQTSKYIG